MLVTELEDGIIDIIDSNVIWQEVFLERRLGPATFQPGPNTCMLGKVEDILRHNSGHATINLIFFKSPLKLREEFPQLRQRVDVQEAVSAHQATEDCFEQIFDILTPVWGLRSNNAMVQRWPHLTKFFDAHCPAMDQPLRKQFTTVFIDSKAAERLFHFHFWVLQCLAGKSHAVFVFVEVTGDKTTDETMSTQTSSNQSNTYYLHINIGLTRDT
ncbi:MAG: hypothetical protein RLY57_596 [Candidatus Parcubacteria bacterium]